MSEGRHALLAPSAAGRWVRCTGSVSLCALYPGEDSPESREGTEAHEVAESVFAGKKPDADPEMVAAAELYLSAVNDLGVPEDKWHTEEWVDCFSIHEQNGGTPDRWAYHNNTAYVVDFKYGHRFVDVVENWQMLNYLAGVLDKLGTEQVDHIVFLIVQPRCYHRDGTVRTWKFAYRDAMPYLERLHEAAHKSLSADAKFVPGPKQCRDCEGRHACEALQLASYDAASLSQGALPLELPPDALGYELKVLERANALLTARVKALREQAIALIQKNKPVSGWALDRGRGRTVWDKDEEEILTLGKMLGVDVRKPGVITPGQATKAGIDEAVIKAYSKKRPGEQTLVPEDSSRAAVAFSKR